LIGGRTRARSLRDFDQQRNRNEGLDLLLAVPDFRAHGLVHENQNSLVISYSPTEHGYEGLCYETLSWMRALPRMASHVLDAGHELLETHADAAVSLMPDFIRRTQRE
jgi:hypothetical protein